MNGFVAKNADGGGQEAGAERKGLVSRRILADTAMAWQAWRDGPLRGIFHSCGLLGERIRRAGLLTAW